MADIDNVIKGIEHCTNMEYGKGNNSCAGCPYLIPHGGFNQFRCGSQDLLKDALELLKEQQQRIEALEIDRDILVNDINTNNCNTCKRHCEHRPMPGEVVRSNCFMWDGDE